MKKVMLLILAFILIIIWICSCAPTAVKPIIPVTPGLSDVIKNMNSVTLFSFLGIGLSIFAFLQGYKWGLSALISAIVCLILSIVIAQYAGYIALFGALTVAAIVGYTIYINRKALKQVVEGVEKVKDTMHTTDGYAVNELLTKDIQDPSTIKIVQDIKKTL
jgi:hypothetical protein